MCRSISISILCLLACIISACRSDLLQESVSSCEYARYFDIVEIADSAHEKAVVVISPYNNSRDTLMIDRPFDNIVCMSTSQVAGLSELGVDSHITAVSGLKYITNPNIRNRSAHSNGTLRPIYDVGYEASLDFERIIKLKPDVVLTYTISGAEPQYISKLRSLGVRVLMLHDHLENHPLARAEYIRLYGALVGRQAFADSVFNSISQHYVSLASKSTESKQKKRVLMNVPFGDAWYIPGADSYMSRLIQDAGGVVVGAEPGTASSRVIGMEEAYSLSLESDIWLNPGPCRTRQELVDYHHAFRFFGPIANELPIYNNTLRMTPEGGNDFWESGSVRPDLILEDLVSILSSYIMAGEQDCSDSHLKYHFKVE